MIDAAQTNVVTIEHWPYTTTEARRYFSPRDLESGDSWRVYLAASDDARRHAAMDDPDVGLDLKPVFVARLRRQAKRAEAGDSGAPLDGVLSDLSLTL